MNERALADWQYANQSELDAQIPHDEVVDVDIDLYDGTRKCDECGRVTDAGEFPDWVNGKCEDCDPDIWEHPDNVARMHPDVLVEYTIGFYVPGFVKSDGTLDRRRVVEEYMNYVYTWVQDGVTPNVDDVTITEE